ncbi:MAG: GPW/gp25 family protein [Deltaproteobacteria bacterium]|nr:GPW/gp25 family protein [Deltaproteobacteria bacterium]MCW5809017.1 GPW/gp25 family protein [Deltaproteobacteria bacterium]
MAREFLGRGWKFPIAVDRDGRIVGESEDEKVREAIVMILRTAPGERMMRPDFGCGIHELVFESLTDELVGRVRTEVTRALAAWEPRVDVLAVQVQPDRDVHTRLLIQIDYRVRSTNSRFNLVFPFYVQ